MRKGGGKAKGASFERDVCKRLSLWVSNDTREDWFWRSAMSGGRATVGAKKGKDLRHQAGDITAVHPGGHVLTDEWFIECKHVKYLGLDQFLVKGTGPLATFWGKCRKEAFAHDKTPVIIAKQNGWPTLLMGSYILLSRATGLHPIIEGIDIVFAVWSFEKVLDHPFLDVMTLT